MPLFNYRCDICDAIVEHLHSREEDMSDEQCPNSPECPGHIVKLLSSVPFKFSSGAPTLQVQHHD